jgi:hypothetical protein
MLLLSVFQSDVLSLRRADHSFRGVLPCVCMCVVKKLRKREAKGPSWNISAADATHKNKETN